jgi:uncharacterized membrane protein
MSSTIRLAIMLAITAVAGALVSQVLLPWVGIVVIGACCGILWGVASYSDATKVSGNLRRAQVWLGFLAGAGVLAIYVISRGRLVDVRDRLGLFVAAVVSASALAELVLILRMSGGGETPNPPGKSQQN